MLLRTRRLDFDTTNIRHFRCLPQPEGCIKKLKLRKTFEVEGLYVSMKLDHFWTRRVKGPPGIWVVWLQSSHLKGRWFRDFAKKEWNIWSQAHAEMEPRRHGSRTSPRQSKSVQNWWRTERSGDLGIRNWSSHPPIGHHPRHYFTSTHHFWLKIGRDRQHGMCFTPQP
jgi:hypothetical protein